MSEMQLDLFSGGHVNGLDRGYQPAAARSGDPASSHLAAREHGRSGLRHKNTGLVARAVAENPGLTAVELYVRCCGGDGQYGHLSRHEWSRRLPDAERFGLINRGDLRKCLHTGRPCLTWWPRPPRRTDR